MSHPLAPSILAVDLGGTSILVGEVTQRGEVLHSRSYRSDTTSQAAAMARITQSIQHYYEHERCLDREQVAIGIGVVGRVDTQQGIWLEIQPGKTDPTNVKQLIEAKFKLPCGIDNDVACATKAEQRFGWGTVSDDFIYYNIGTGIAAGFVVAGRYIEGNQFNAGEVGHMVVTLGSGIACPCGRTGCVERIASGLGLHERIMALKPGYPASAVAIPDGERLQARHLFKTAQAGDALAVRVTEEAAEAVAAALMNLVRVSDPDTIVLGGGVARSDYFRNRIHHYLNPRTMRFVANGIVTTKQATLEAGLVGAALAGYEALAQRTAGITMPDRAAEMDKGADER
ncbi:ROK family protein [Paenibacillus sp. MMS18-CY102]|uniref:ROK family protein n=1 Tax=Paenibacillus sp. MMS18-CY102 TaxID=2682849 RepID=UPI0013656B81|nr:ROK family protein [Paenibacillus sp. MMS18-CY102]MWC30980.1 ROK family protein [Paenibacillus sp. MMS18-CY102]